MQSRTFRREAKAIKTLAAVLLIVLVSGLSIADEATVGKSAAPNQTPRNSLLADISFAMAHICESFAANCLPSNLLNSPVAAYIKIFVPSSQVYTRYFFITDTEGAVVGFNASASSLNNGVNDLSMSFSLPTGNVYRFFAIVQGADGKMAVSDPYTFRVF